LRRYETATGYAIVPQVTVFLLLSAVEPLAFLVRCVTLRPLALKGLLADPFLHMKSASL
jgi:hypothetical protein